MSYQENEYNSLQTSIPCVFRGPLELDIYYNKESPCCKDKGQVQGSKFYCSFYQKYITTSTSCWACKERK